jgi:hypothetical protein
MAAAFVKPIIIIIIEQLNAESNVEIYLIFSFFSSCQQSS